LEQELVSILIPVYNRVNLVGETIESAINQTYKNIEIVICDNCSIDGTWEILQQYTRKDKRIRIFRNRENIGPVRNWLKCLELASGQFIKILWSDDLIEPSFISECISFIDGDMAFVITGIKTIDEAKQKNQIVYSKTVYQKLRSEEYLKKILVFDPYKYPVSPGCALFRRKDLIENLIIAVPNNDNMVSSNTGAGTDLLFYLLTALKYSNIGIINKSLSVFRTHKDSISVSFGSKLFLAYDWARFYFIQNHYYELISDFICHVNRLHRNSKLYSNLYSQLENYEKFSVIIFIKYYALSCYYRFTYERIKYKFLHMHIWTRKL